MAVTEALPRWELVGRIALERAQYELLHAGRESGWQPLRQFVRDETYRLARRGHSIPRVQAHQDEYGWSFHARVSWDRLAREVAPVTARMKRRIIEEASA
jgi:hypothetical protein